MPSHAYKCMLPSIARVSSNIVNIDLEAVPKYSKTSSLWATSFDAMNHRCQRKTVDSIGVIKQGNRYCAHKNTICAKMILLGPWLDYVQVRPTKIQKKWRLMPVFCLCSQCDVGFYLLDNVAFCSLVARWFLRLFHIFFCVHVFLFFQLCCCCHVCLLLALSIFSDRREKLLFILQVRRSPTKVSESSKSQGPGIHQSVSPFCAGKGVWTIQLSQCGKEISPIKDDPNFVHVFPMFTFTCWKRPLCVCA